jgi:dTDP-4-dehydrorhamnose reductase
VIRVLVTGARGQVGADLARELEGRAQVVAHDRTSLDLAKPGDIVARVREFAPHVIVNAAGYTAVDRAESDVEAARAVNAAAPGVLAEEAKRLGAFLVHYSTDYVFDGSKPSPYVETDPTAPLNAYGRTKLEGERAVAASGCDHAILRTSWVYAPHGKNFMLTMLRLAATQSEIRVVDDQRGSPTSSRQLARATLDLLAHGEGSRPLTVSDVARVREACGLYHASAAEETTWFGFAREIFGAWSQRAGSAFRPPRLIAIPTRDYPTPARRPANSVLSSAKLEKVFGVRIGSWRDGLEEAISTLPVP